MSDWRIECTTVEDSNRRPVGYFHSAARRGRLPLLWGLGELGQLGAGNCHNRRAPTRVAGLPAPVRQVTAGYRQTGIVTDAGHLLRCGFGEYGQLGLGDEDNRTTPTEGSSVYTFGCGDAGRLGHGNEENQLAPRQVPAAGLHHEQVVMVAVGSAHTVALSAEGQVYTWGWGFFGQLGHNDLVNQLVPRQVEPGRLGGEKVVFEAAGEDHTAAVTGGGRLYTWGTGVAGQLGHGDERNRRTPGPVGAGAFRGAAVVMAACGGEHTLVVTHEGALWAFGLVLNACKLSFEGGAWRIWRRTDRGCRGWRFALGGGDGGRRALDLGLRL